MLTLSGLSLGLAYLSYRFVEQPFRRGVMPALPRQKQVFQASLAAMGVFLVIGASGIIGKGFPGRFDNIKSPQRWAEMPCHGHDSVAQYADPLAACLGSEPNRRPGDIFLLGDSHAAQLTFPLRALAEHRDVTFAHMSNMSGQFPHRRYFEQHPPVEDRALEHMLRISDPGDHLVLIFHRGHLNETRDMHLDLENPVKENSREILFQKNFIQNITPFLDRGVNVSLVLDTPLLPEWSWLERCAFTLLRFGSHGCTIEWVQDEHTRSRQQRVFESIHKETGIPVLDPLPYLYSEDGYFDPILPDGSYLMFDSNHLTELGALRLLPLFASALISESEE